MKILPLAILGAFTFLGLGISMAQHGKPRSKESFWTTSFSFAIQWSLILWAVS